MKELLQVMLARLHGGERVVLCTILDSQGSAPRGAGARMAVLADGEALDTVGGGEMERRAIERAKVLLQTGRSETGRYLLHPDREADIGMVCGGEVLLGFQCFFPEDAPQISVLEQLLTLLDGCGCGWLETVYRTDGTASLALLGEDLHDTREPAALTPVLERGELQTRYLERVARRENVYIFGCGHVGRALTPALAALGFSVTVYDERPSLAQEARFPAASRVLCGTFDPLLPEIHIQPEDYVVVMTPGHMADFSVLRQVLRTPATYIGCIGSAKKVAYVNGRLREEGFSEADIARIHAPIGLPILAQTPEEIAVSIAAQLIYHRHGGRQAATLAIP